MRVSRIRGRVQDKVLQMLHLLHVVEQSGAGLHMQTTKRKGFGAIPLPNGAEMFPVFFFFTLN